MQVARNSPHQDDVSLILSQAVLAEREGWRGIWTKRLYDPIYNGLLTLITLMYTIVLFLVDVDRHIILLGVKYAVEMPAFILSIIFLLDLLANLIIAGPKKTVKHRKLLILEALLQIAYWISFTADIIDTGTDSNLSRFTRVNAIF